MRFSSFLLLSLAIIPFFAQECIEPDCLNCLNVTTFTKKDLIAHNWTFENFANDSNNTVVFMNETYLGGSDHSRISFNRTFNVTNPHYNLTVSFKLITYDGLDPNDRFLVFADGIHVYSFDPTLYEGLGPHNISFSFIHQEPKVLLQFISEDSNVTKPKEAEIESARLLVSFDKPRILALTDPYNVAFGKKTKMSSTEKDFTSSFAVDGVLDHRADSLSIAKTHMTFAPDIPWFYVDLEEARNISEVRIILGENVTFENASIQYVLTIGNDSNITNNSICKDGLDIGSGAFSCDLNGRYVGIYYKMLNVSSGQLEIAEIEILEKIENVVFNATANQSSILAENETLYGASKAVDGSTWIDWKKGFSSVTKIQDYPWWRADLGKARKIKFIRFYVDNYQNDSYVNYINISVGNDTNVTANKYCVQESPNSMEFNCNITGKYIGVVYQGFNYMEMAEIEAFSEIIPKPEPEPQPEPEPEPVPIPIELVNYAIRDLKVRVNICDKLCDACAGSKICVPEAKQVALLYHNFYDENQFRSELNGWKYDKIDDRDFDFKCASKLYLGGYGRWGPGGYFEKTYPIIPYHYKLRISFDFLVLDEFANRTDEFLVFADDEVVFRYSPLINVNKKNLTIDGYEYLCGVKDKLDIQERIHFEFLHFNHTLKLKFLSNSTVPALNASYGIAKLDIEFYNCYSKKGCYALGADNAHIELDRSRRLEEGNLRNGGF